MVFILAEIAAAVHRVQKDTSNIVDVIDILYAIKKSWSSNPTLGDETRAKVLNFFQKRCKMIAESPLGSIASFLMVFLFDDPTKVSDVLSGVDGTSAAKH